ncbi:right-handed parallel beta-helix repeat-containing protein [bacterium]|nr:right-handed parallel beta-helix repeat-containing protein [bacterium]
MKQKLINCLPLFLGALILAPTARAANVDFQAAINGAAGGVLNLDAGNLYVGPAYLGSDLVINGNGATVDLEIGADPGESLWLMAGEGVTLTINDLTFINGEVGVLFGGGAVGTLTNVTFEQIKTGGQGVSAAGGGALDLTNCTFDGMDHAGMYVGWNMAAFGGIAMTVDQCNFTNVGSGIIGNGGSLTLTSTDFQVSDVGVAMGGNTITASGCTIQGTPDYGFHLYVFDSTNPTLTLEQTTISNAATAVQIANGDLTIRNCQFSNGVQGISAISGLGSPGKHAVIENVDITGASLVAFNVPNGGYVDITGGAWNQCQGTMFLDNGVHATVANFSANVEPVHTPGDSIRFQNGSTMTITNSVLTGGVNNLKFVSDSTLVARNVQFIRPYFSGIICEDNSNADVENCEFIDNGMDGFYTGLAVLNRPSNGRVVNNRITRAGAGEPDESIGRPVQAGSGIALAGEGNWTVTDNDIVGSYDVGISLGNNTTSIVRRNSIVDNRLSGITIHNIAYTAIEDNLIVGHTGDGQSGIVLLNATSGGINIQRNLVAENRFGISASQVGDSITISDCLIPYQDVQGIVMNAGTASAYRCGLVNATDFLVVFAGPAAGVIHDSSLMSTANLGVYQGTGGPADATSNYWGPNGATSGRAKTVYHNANVNPTRSSSPVELYYSGDTFSGRAPVTVTNSGSTWANVSSPAATESRTVMGMMRRISDLADTPPTGVSDARAISLWTSENWRKRTDLVTIDVQTSADRDGLVLALYDRDAGELIPVALTTPKGGTTDHVEFSIRASDMKCGTYYLADIPLTVGATGFMMTGP